MLTRIGVRVAFCVIAAAVLGAPPAAHAQTPAPAAAIEAVFAGDCAITVTKGALRAGDRAVVELGGGGGALGVVVVTAETRFPIEFPTGEAVGLGEKFRLKINGEAVGDDVAAKASGDRPDGRRATGTCTPAKDEAVDDVPSFDATGYFGWAYDQFAPSPLGNYPVGTATASHNRYLFGMDFDYRIRGNGSSKGQIWLAGQTLHGVRSADVDCTAENEKKSQICEETLSLGRTRAVLQNATSVEFYATPRIELATLNDGASTPATLYLTARLGAIALTGAPHFYQNHHVGLGLMAEGTTFAGSTLEVGYGNNELLANGTKFTRFKLSAVLSVALDSIPGLRDKGRFFIEMFLDTGRGNAPDSMQTFIGFDFDFRKLLGGG